VLFAENASSYQSMKSEILNWHFLATKTEDKVYFHFVLSSLGCERTLPGLNREIGLFVFAIPRMGTRSRILKLSVFLLKGFIVFETDAIVMLPFLLIRFSGPLEA
jgi:hypothetical protein